MFGLKKTSSQVVRGNDCQITAVAEKYVDTTIKIVDPVAIEEKIAANKKIVEFFEAEAKESDFGNEKKVLLQKCKEFEKEGELLIVQLEQAKFSGKYPCIDLSFLSMKRSNNNDKRDTKEDVEAYKVVPYKPVFSFHRLGGVEGCFNFAPCEFIVNGLTTISKRSTIQGIAVRDGNELIMRNFIKVFTQGELEYVSNIQYERSYLSRKVPRIGGNSWYSNDIEFRSEFNGCVPSATKKKLYESLEHFRSNSQYDIFLIKECTDWQTEVITRDPLIVGLLGNQAYLIDHFDCTDIEAYARKEFTS